MFEFFPVDSGKICSAIYVIDNFMAGNKARIILVELKDCPSN